MRVSRDAAEPLRCGRLTVDPGGAFAELDGEELPLTFAQRLLLARLVERAGKVSTRAELYEAAFGDRLSRGSRAIDQHINGIRRGLGAHRNAVRSVTRVGYLLDPASLA